MTRRGLTFVLTLVELVLILEGCSREDSRGVPQSAQPFFFLVYYCSRGLARSTLLIVSRLSPDKRYA